MPCPLFLPDSETCAAQPEFAPDREMLRSACLPGYARAICSHAAALEADAVRLLVRSHHGPIIAIAWSLERNHHPVAVGVVEINTAEVHTEGPASTTLERQAKALVSEYLRRTGQE